MSWVRCWSMIVTFIVWRGLFLCPDRVASFFPVAAGGHLSPPRTVESPSITFQWLQRWRYSSLIFAPWTGVAREIATRSERRFRTPLLLTAILADAINLGLAKMAEVCPGTSLAKPPWAWPGTSVMRRKTLAELVNLAHRIPFAAHRGEETTFSSDGHRHRAAVLSGRYLENGRFRGGREFAKSKRRQPREIQRVSRVAQSSCGSIRQAARQKSYGIDGGAAAVDQMSTPGGKQRRQKDGSSGSTA